MYTKVGLTTGTISYYADNELFSSLNKKIVLEFEGENINSKYDFENRKHAHTYMFGGYCPIADEYVHDHASASVLGNEAQKDYKKSRRGNWCPLKASKIRRTTSENYIKNKGYC